MLLRPQYQQHYLRWQDLFPILYDQTVEQSAAKDTVSSRYKFWFALDQPVALVINGY